ncbi:MAG: Lrp/AsnC ligand binding domain-containing protein [Acidilobaceae archaeon]|nr:Lrp/AsnC ligand binding domain-containing protein [Acidilobaceae archaeon]
MSSEAIVMINVDTGKEDEIFNKLLELPEVQEVYMIYGVHDIMVILRTSDMDSMRNVITQKIRKMSGVKSTITSIVIKKQTKQ